MLCVNSYKQDYIDKCRSAMDAQIDTYKVLVTAARVSNAANPAFDSARAAFEPLFFNNLVVVLDGFFVHRSRTLEKKDGNPLNEVRMICTSLLQNHGVLAEDKTIRFSPSTSVLKLQVGDKIQMSESDFVRLAKAFFDELETKFS